MSTATDHPLQTPAPGTPPPELAPSATVAEGPAFARMIGFFGLFLLVVGLVAVVTNRVLTPRWISTTFGYFLCATGLVLMLYHAVRDREKEVRRMYGAVAALAILLGLAAALIPGPVFGKEAVAAAEQKTQAVGHNLLPWGVGGGLLGLLFLIPFTRHEDDPVYRRIAVLTLLGMGAALSVGSVIAGMARPDFLAGPGLALALLGLGYLCAYLGQVDTSEGTGYLVAFGLGAFGAAVVVYAVARCAVPTMLYEGPAALRQVDNSVDKWKVAARLIVGLGFAAAAGYGVMAKNVPLWLRSTLVALGVAGIGVLVYSSTTRAPINSPMPFLIPGGVLLAAIGLVYLALSLGACSDNAFITLTRREMSAYFISPIGYLVLGGMVLAEWLGYWFFVGGLESASRRGGMPEPIVQFYLLALIPVIAQTFLVPALTMGLLAEEKRTGSLEVLLTAPVTEAAVVLSKFVATLVFYMITWVPAALLLIPLRMELGVDFDYKPLLSFYLALAACGAAFIGMGMFFSALTRNQIVAAVLTFVGMLMFLVFYFVKERTTGFGQLPQLVMTKMSYVDLWMESLSGQLPIRDVLLWVSLAVFWLFLALKVLEVRKWS
jgi:hypothetical protein